MLAVQHSVFAILLSGKIPIKCLKTYMFVTFFLKDVANRKMKKKKKIEDPLVF